VLKTFTDREDLMIELDMLYELRASPYTIQLLGVDRATSSLLMEFAPYGDLRRVLRSAARASLPVPLSLKMAWASDVADALVYMHDRNIVHLDVKAQNVLVFAEPRLHVKLTDFECCTHPNIIRAGWGTEGFKAPEIFARPVTKAADTYSWTAFFCELLTVRIPGVYGLRSQVVQEAQAVSLPDWMVDMLRTCCDMEPEVRWPMGRVFTSLLRYLCRESDGDPRVRSAHPDHPVVLDLVRHLERCSAGGVGLTSAEPDSEAEVGTIEVPTSDAEAEEDDAEDAEAEEDEAEADEAPTADAEAEEDEAEADEAEADDVSQQAAEAPQPAAEAAAADALEPTESDLCPNPMGKRRCRDIYAR